jgi:hypothetical protein
MAKALTSEQYGLIQAHKHLPYRDIAAKAGCSLGMVSKVLTPPDPTLPRDAPGPTDVDRAVERAGRLTAVDLTADDTYRDCIADLTRAGQIAADGEDVARMVSVQRARAAVTKMREDARPVPPPDEDKALDMIAAARRARAMLWQLLGTSPEVGPDGR